MELVGSALFDPYVREYAPKADRYRHIVARLSKVPTLVGQAKANLVEAPEIWNTVAQHENDGTIALVPENAGSEIVRPGIRTGKPLLRS